MTSAPSAKAVTRAKKGISRTRSIRNDGSIEGGWIRLHHGKVQA